MSKWWSEENSWERYKADEIKAETSMFSKWSHCMVQTVKECMRHSWKLQVL